MTPGQRTDLVWLLALAAPLAARLAGEGAGAAQARLLLLAAAIAFVYGWAALFARLQKRGLGDGLAGFAMVFVLLLPATSAWGSALVALGFGAVFGREIFGARAVLPPALLALGFAIFAFPGAGFEALGVLDDAPDPRFALACLAAAAAIWAATRALAWQVAAGAALGVFIAAQWLGDYTGWEHLVRGNLAAGVLFLAAAPATAVPGRLGQWLHGVLAGVLIVVIRVAHPDQPDGVVFALLFAALFAPLLHRACAWRPRRA